MTIFDARDLISFPTGDNASDTVLGGLHFNLTTLQHWNYTIYDNGTMSNGSKCFLTFSPYEPKLLYANGTFINATSCYSPINHIGERATIGIVLAVVFGLCLVFNLMCLRRHGRLYLPAEKRFWPIGRRWQWYWGTLLCTVALISLFTSIDVDRYYLVELPIVLTSFFWFIMQMCAMATVWEGVRHWGSWMERQYVDPNPFSLPLDDRRAMFELLIPLVFYLFLWLNFFLVVPRSWGSIEMQRSPEQTELRAKPSATDSRFKAAAFSLLLSWLVVVVSLRHSMQHYLPRNRGLFNRAVGLVTTMPFRFVLLLPLSLAIVAYQALAAWEFQYSIMNVKGNKLAIFLGGYAPSLLIVLVQIVYGFFSPNEDQELIRQRRLRGAENNRALGIVPKPAWWRRINGDFPEGERMRDRIARNVREIGGGRATARKIDQAMAARAHEADAVEMNDLTSTSASKPARGGSFASVDTSRQTISAYGGKSDHRRTERTVAAAASMLFPTTAGPSVDRRAELMKDGPPPPYRDGEGQRGRSRDLPSSQDRPGTSERSNSTGTLASISGPPQQVRSMLDI